LASWAANPALTANSITIVRVSKLLKHVLRDRVIRGGHRSIAADKVQDTWMPTTKSEVQLRARTGKLRRIGVIGAASDTVGSAAGNVIAATSIQIVEISTVKQYAVPLPNFTDAEVLLADHDRVTGAICEPSGRIARLPGISGKLTAAVARYV